MVEKTQKGGIYRRGREGGEAKTWTDKTLLTQTG